MYLNLLDMIVKFDTRVQDKLNLHLDQNGSHSLLKI